MKAWKFLEPRDASCKLLVWSGLGAHAARLWDSFIADSRANLKNIPRCPSKTSQSAPQNQEKTSGTLQRGGRKSKLNHWPDQVSQQAPKSADAEVDSDGERRTHRDVSIRCFAPQMSTRARAGPAQGLGETSGQRPCPPLRRRLSRACERHQAPPQASPVLSLPLLLLEPSPPHTPTGHPSPGPPPWAPFTSGWDP